MSNNVKVTVTVGSSNLSSFYAAQRRAAEAAAERESPRREVTTYAFNGTDTFTAGRGNYRTYEELQQQADNSFIMRFFDWIIGYRS